MNKLGMIFPAVIWMVIGVTAMLMLQRQSVQADVRLAGYAKGHAEALGHAFSGLAWARHTLANSKKQADQPDSLYNIGLDEDQVKDIKQALLPSDEWEGKFSIDIGDESGKLNINVAPAEWIKPLLTYYGVNQSEAQIIAQSIVDWRSEAIPNQNSMESGDIKIKHQLFQSVDELRLVPGVTTEIFDKIKEDVTVFPIGKSNNLEINVLTAPQGVRAVLAEVFKFNNSVAACDSVEDLKRTFARVQLGKDGVARTADDGAIAQSGDEATCFESIKSSGAQSQAVLGYSLKGVQKASTYHVVIRGESANHKVNVFLSAILNKDANGATQILSTRLVKL